LKKQSSKGLGDTIAKITRVDLDNDRLYYDFVSWPSSVDFVNGELVFSNSTTAAVGEKNRYQDGSFDDNNTTTDKVFKFKIKARDTANFSELIREFSIKIVEDNSKIFANLFVKKRNSKGCQSWN
jgi:hypothetical protein